MIEPAYKFGQEICLGEKLAILKNSFLTLFAKQVRKDYRFIINEIPCSISFLNLQGTTELILFSFCWYFDGACAELDEVLRMTKSNCAPLDVMKTKLYSTKFNSSTSSNVSGLITRILSCLPFTSNNTKTFWVEKPVTFGVQGVCSCA